MRFSSVFLILLIGCRRLEDVASFTRPWIPREATARNMLLREGSELHSKLAPQQNELSQDISTMNQRWEEPDTNAHSPQRIPQLLASFIMASMLLLTNVPNTPPLPATHSFGGTAQAIESRVIGEIKGSGLVFKDVLNVESFEDPKVQGVTLYVTNFQRPITERISKDFFSDPSSASVGCAKTGPVKVAENIGTGLGGEEVFEESRSLLFKTLRVQRVYDKEKNTVVYVTYNTRFDKSNDDNKSRFKSSICAVNLD